MKASACLSWVEPFQRSYLWNFHQKFVDLQALLSQSRRSIFTTAFIVFWSCGQSGYFYAGVVEQTSVNDK